MATRATESSSKRSSVWARFDGFELDEANVRLCARSAICEPCSTELRLQLRARFLRHIAPATVSCCVGAD